MSIDRCSNCHNFVDTDFDLEFYGNDGNGFKWDIFHFNGLCEECREDKEHECGLVADTATT
ncbi:MAG: hypothetical protein D4R39_00930 [Methylophilaceae bacterium]|nr:MAG: hypothetical protein D4R39_00930 [Methylophilaceae bacterium]